MIDRAHSCLAVGLRRRWILIDGRLDAAAAGTGSGESGIERPDVEFVLIPHGDTEHIGGLLGEGPHPPLSGRDLRFALPLPGVRADR